MFTFINFSRVMYEQNIGHCTNFHVPKFFVATIALTYRRQQRIGGRLKITFRFPDVLKCENLSKTRKWNTFLRLTNLTYSLLRIMGIFLN